MPEETRPKIENLETPGQELTPEEAEQAGGGFFSEVIRRMMPPPDVLMGGAGNDRLTGEGVESGIRGGMGSDHLR